MVMLEPWALSSLWIRVLTAKELITTLSVLGVRRIRLNG
jgi:hypothetical protein